MQLHSLDQSKRFILSAFFFFPLESTGPRYLVIQS
jgi:hypothetical protein